jgi:hypothetical protein
LKKHNDLDFEINKDLLNKFKRPSNNDEKDNTITKNIKPDRIGLNGTNLNKKVEHLSNGNNQNNIQFTTLGTKERESNINHSKKLLETIQNQLINNNKENNLNTLNSASLNHPKQKVLSENVLSKNLESNVTKSFLNKNIVERVYIRSNNHEHK